MEQPGETDALRDRLSRLSEASLRIKESLDLDTVLQGVNDNAHTLAGAQCGGISTKGCAASWERTRAASHTSSPRIVSATV